MSIRITVDVENLSGSVTDSSFVRPLKPFLELLEIHNTKATFFIVGSLAPVWNDQLIELSKAGHEIGLHGHTHDYLEDLGPLKFRRDLIEGKEILQNVIGKEIIGFRAPYFSLTKESVWAQEILFESGFKFSSSVLPVWNPQAGYPTAPRYPFTWMSGLVEFPVPTFGLGRVGIPLLGGAYVRLIPNALFNIARVIGTQREYEWSYCHPYDFDTETKFDRIRDTSMLFSKLLYARRIKMLGRVERLLLGGPAKSFEEHLGSNDFMNSLSRFS
jgi:polysaccharide deacetylase family protein (PEP-CTERM system associated)